MAADYRHIGGVENRLGRHYSRFSPFSPTPALADQSLALRKSWNAGSNRRSQVRLARAVPDPSFAKFSCQHRVPRRFELLEINRLIVRSAEDMVFYCNNLPWIPKFIAKNRHYRIEAVTERVPLGTGFLNIATQRVVAYQRS